VANDSNLFMYLFIFNGLDVSMLKQSLMYLHRNIGNRVYVFFVFFRHLLSSQFFKMSR